MQPVFNAQRLLVYVGQIVEATDHMLTPGKSSRHRPIDRLASEMTRLTCTIIARILLGADLSADIADVEQSATVVMAPPGDGWERIVDPPLWVPTPGNVQFRKAKQRLDDIVQRLIADRRKRALEERLACPSLAGAR